MATEPQCARPWCSYPAWDGQDGSCCSKRCLQWPECVRPGCLEYAFEDKAGAYCSFRCRDQPTCIRPGCGNALDDDDEGGFCSDACQAAPSCANGCGKLAREGHQFCGRKCGQASAAARAPCGAGGAGGNLPTLLQMQPPTPRAMATPRGAPPPTATATRVRAALDGLARTRSARSFVGTQPLAPEPGFPRKLKLFHGTTRKLAAAIQASGFKVSTDGELGPGVYMVGETNVAKARRFAHDWALRESKAGRQTTRGSTDDDPVVVECLVFVKMPKFLKGSDAKGDWRQRGYDAARCDCTDQSTSSEWCVSDPRSVVVRRIIDISSEQCPWLSRQCTYRGSGITCPCRGP